MITSALAAFAATARPAPSALAMMRLSLFDWGACAAAGVAEPVAGIVRGMALAEAGTPEAGLAGGGRVPARMAALVNGTISHALDYDDTHFAHIGHPSVAVVPAALAVAERQGAGAEDFLAACLVGAEASVRVGLWLGRSHYQAGFHQTGTAGAFGAALAAGRLMGLDRAGLRQALGLVATRAAGLKAEFGTMGKPLNAGAAAANGVEAALLAAAGFVAREEALDTGFGPTHHGEGAETTLDGLGVGWLFDEVSHKFHACCHGLHASLEALRSLRPEGAVEAVEAVEIATHPRWLSVCDIAAPATGLEAKFSYRLTAAMVLSGVETGALDAFCDAAAADPVLVALRDRVTVIADDGLTEMQARVRVRAGGRWTAAAHDLAAPLPLAEREGKLRTKAVALLGDHRAERLWRICAAPDPAALADWLAG